MLGLVNYTRPPEEAVLAIALAPNATQEVARAEPRWDVADLGLWGGVADEAEAGVGHGAPGSPPTQTGGFAMVVMRSNTAMMHDNFVSSMMNDHLNACRERDVKKG
jgi:hypothetical protein